MADTTQQFSKIFEGDNDAYGTYKFKGTLREDGKVEGHGITHRKTVTQDQWKKHLSGKTMLGISPINSSNESKFAVIDVDQYNISLTELSGKVNSSELPLVLFRSKSGGAHIYLFCKDFVPASLIQDKIRKCAAYLGLGSSEIFPKQTEVVAERGDVGNWINLPYFNATDTTQFAYGPDNEELSVEDFIQYYNKRAMDGDTLRKLTISIASEYKDGPPCLEHIDALGMPIGMRNASLFNFGVYFKKKYGDGWKKPFEEYNHSLSSPLEAREILILIKSLDSKSYNYQCKKEPLCNHCNSKLCRSRKFGVGEGSGLPALGTLTRVNTSPPIWFLGLEDGGRLELSTEDLQNMRSFQKRCMEALNIMPVMPDKKSWEVLIGKLMEQVNIIDIPKELSPKGQLLSLMESFIRERPRSERVSHILRGMVWEKDNRVYFDVIDFQKYLERKRFMELRNHQIMASMQEFGCQWEEVKIRGTMKKVVSYKNIKPLEAEPEDEEDY